MTSSSGDDTGELNANSLSDSDHEASDSAAVDLAEESKVEIVGEDGGTLSGSAEQSSGSPGVEHELLDAQHEAARIREEAREMGADIISEMRVQAQNEAARIVEQEGTNTGGVPKSDRLGAVEIPPRRQRQTRRHQPHGRRRTIGRPHRNLE